MSFSDTYFTKYNILLVHPHCCKWQNFTLFYGRVIFSCVYVCVYSPLSLSIGVSMDSQAASISQFCKQCC